MKCTVIPARNDTYPPTATSGWPSGYRITIDLCREGVLFAEAVNEVMVADYGTYVKYKGSFTGTLNGVVLPDGVALYEEVNNLIGT